MLTIINWHDFQKETPEDILGDEAFDATYLVSHTHLFKVYLQQGYHKNTWEQAEVEYWALMPEKPRKPDSSVWLSANKPLKENSNYVE